MTDRNPFCESKLTTRSTKTEPEPEHSVLNGPMTTALVNRDQLDYTEWRKRQWLDETVSSLAVKARLLRATNPDL